jgi:hypothetical protein
MTTQAIIYSSSATVTARNISTEIRHLTIVSTGTSTGGTDSIRNPGAPPSVKVADTPLEGAQTGSNFTCFGVYNAGFAEVTCPKLDLRSSRAGPDHSRQLVWRHLGFGSASMESMAARLIMTRTDSKSCQFEFLWRRDASNLQTKQQTAIPVSFHLRLGKVLHASGRDCLPSLVAEGNKGCSRNQTSSAIRCRDFEIDAPWRQKNTRSPGRVRGEACRATRRLWSPLNLVR